MSFYADCFESTWEEIYNSKLFSWLYIYFRWRTHNGIRVTSLLSVPCSCVLTLLKIFNVRYLFTRWYTFSKDDDPVNHLLNILFLISFFLMIQVNVEMMSSHREKGSLLLMEHNVISQAFLTLISYSGYEKTLNLTVVHYFIPKKLMFWKHVTSLLIN